MKAQTDHHIESKDPIRRVMQVEELNEIRDEDVQAVIWNRQTPRSYSSPLGALPAHDVENGRFYVPIGEIGSCIEDLFKEWRWDIGEAQQWLVSDVKTLASQMASILSNSFFRLRVELVRDDACRRFHRDTVRARLICTYSGPGTEFGVARDGERPHHIDTVLTGSPILLKGKLWSCSPRQTVLHRSPPIEKAGVSRLVVVLDEASTDCP